MTEPIKSPKPVLNYASTRVVKPPTIWGTIIVTIISGLVAIAMLFTVFYFASVGMFEGPIDAFGAIWSTWLVSAACLLLSTIAAWLWFAGCVRSLQSQIANPPGIAVILMLIAIGIGLVDLATLIASLEAPGDGKTVEERIAVVVLGLCAFVPLAVASVWIWFTGRRRFPGRDKNY